MQRLTGLRIVSRNKSCPNKIRNFNGKKIFRTRVGIKVTDITEPRWNEATATPSRRPETQNTAFSSLHIGYILSRFRSRIAAIRRSAKLIEIKRNDIDQRSRILTRRETCIRYLRSFFSRAAAMDAITRPPCS